MDFLDTAAKFVTGFFDQPPRVMIVLGLVLFGWVIKKSALISDRFIPVLLPALGILLFPLVLGSSGKDIARAAAEGFVGGALAVWLNQLYKQMFVGDSEDPAIASKLFSMLKPKP